jgi:hypothetical protein
LRYRLCSLAAIGAHRASRARFWEAWPRPST